MSSMQRDLAALEAHSFDLLIIGGGITGAGIALDASLRGLKVALIDKGDFAGGTSSVSSKLIHGGLRYLEHGGFRLVHEALTERTLLLRNAPHLVRPLRFVIPCNENARVPRWKWRLGLFLYDLLAGRGNLARSRSLDRQQLRRQVPAIRPEGLQGGAAYFDAQVDDSRLCLEVIGTAALHGACVVNYVEATAFERSGDRITGVVAMDRLTGRTFPIRARQVANAAGPWVDAVCRLAGDTSGPHLRPTKGAHVIVPNQAGLTDALLLLHPADGRVFFVIPWPPRPQPLSPKGRGAGVRGLPAATLLIGTTDTFGDEPPDSLTVTPQDINYLIEGHNAYLGPARAPGSILGSFAGLRPLIRAGAEDPSALSREFKLIDSPGGLLSVAGGKLTTYRHMAEMVTDAVAQKLGCMQPCRTHCFPLDGAPRERWNVFVKQTRELLQAEYGLDEAPADHLIGRYGRRAVEVAGYVAASPELGRPLVHGEPDLRAEWLYQCDHEMAVTPSDYLLRRTRLGLYHPELLRGASARAEPDTALPKPAARTRDTES
jgi:glycerol-3-phosphate dehydrogenase